MAIKGDEDRVALLDWRDEGVVEFVFRPLFLRTLVRVNFVFCCLTFISAKWGVEKSG